MWVLKAEKDYPAIKIGKNIAKNGRSKKKCSMFHKT